MFAYSPDLVITRRLGDVYFCRRQTFVLSLLSLLRTVIRRSAKRKHGEQ